MISVEFLLNKKKRIIYCQKDIKLKEIFKKYAKEENLDINELLFLNCGENISTKEYLNKAVEKILSKVNIIERNIQIIVFQNDFGRSSSNSFEFSSSDSSDEMITNKRYLGYNFFLKLEKYLNY